MARISKNELEQTRGLTRERLLQAAAVEFSQKGYSEANINQISQAAGYAKGTIYNYFPSKQALIRTLIAEASAQHLAYIAGQVRAVSDPSQRLIVFFESGFAFVEEYPALARFLITTLYSAVFDLQAALYEAYQPMFHLLALEILTPGIEQGLFTAADPLATTNLLMTLYLGTASHVDENGKGYMDPHQVADFALHALQWTDKSAANRG